MSHAIEVDRPAVTIAEFDAFLESQDDEFIWELVAGEIVGMTNPTLNHEQIAGNIGAPMNLALRDRGCRVFQGGVRVQSSDDQSGTYKPRPDLVAQCGPVRGERNYITDPLIIVEVLSPGTINRDRGAKLRFYQTSLPSLRHIALVYQDQMRVEQYCRTDIGWEMEVLTAPDDLPSFEAVAFGIDLRAVYEGVTFAGPSRQATDRA